MHRGAQARDPKAFEEPAVQRLAAAGLAPQEVAARLSGPGQTLRGSMVAERNRTRAQTGKTHKL